MEKYVYNCQSYNTFSTLVSDHRVITIKMKLNFPKTQNRIKRKELRLDYFGKQRNKGY